MRRRAQGSSAKATGAKATSAGAKAAGAGTGAKAANARAGAKAVGAGAGAKAADARAGAKAVGAQAVGVAPRRTSRGGARAPAPTAAPLVPPHPTLEELRDAAASCRACDLWKRGTQTVFGEGEPQADVVFVGEQPGDREDREGRPFIGPAGHLLERAIQDAGLDRRRIYVTNAVKHFKWEERGKKRIHQKPNAAEVRACRPWLDAELSVLRPAAVVCLGATAAQALLGKTFRVTQHRGEIVALPIAPIVMGTAHPSSILRAPDERSRHEEYRQLVADLIRLREALRRAAE